MLHCPKNWEVVAMLLTLAARKSMVVSEAGKHIPLRYVPRFHSCLLLTFIAGARYSSLWWHNGYPTSLSPCRNRIFQVWSRGLWFRVSLLRVKRGITSVFLPFSFYNKTEHSGLETHILNSYTNAILQVMHHSLPIRQVAKSHITTNCPREHCLLCELGFVVRMLEDAKGINCQSSNFCKTVGVLAQGSQLIRLCCGDRSHSCSAERDRAYRIRSGVGRNWLCSADPNISPFSHWARKPGRQCVPS